MTTMTKQTPDMNRLTNKTKKSGFRGTTLERSEEKLEESEEKGGATSTSFTSAKPNP